MENGILFPYFPSNPEMKVVFSFMFATDTKMRAEIFAPSTQVIERMVTYTCAVALSFMVTFNAGSIFLKVTFFTEYPGTPCTVCVRLFM